MIFVSFGTVVWTSKHVTPLEGANPKRSHLRKLPAQLAKNFQLYHPRLKKYTRLLTGLAAKHESAARTYPTDPYWWHRIDRLTHQASRGRMATPAWQCPHHAESLHSKECQLHQSFMVSSDNPSRKVTSDLSSALHGSVWYCMPILSADQICLQSFLTAFLASSIFHSTYLFLLSFTDSHSSLSRSAAWTNATTFHVFTQSCFTAAETTALHVQAILGACACNFIPPFCMVEMVFNVICVGKIRGLHHEHPVQPRWPMHVSLLVSL